MQISTEVIIGTIPLRQVIICPPSYSSALLDRRPSTPPPPFEAGYMESYGLFMDDIRKYQLNSLSHICNLFHFLRDQSEFMTRRVDDLTLQTGQILIRPPLQSSIKI